MFILKKNDFMSKELARFLAQKAQWNASQFEKWTDDFERITHADNADRPPIGIEPEWLVKERRLNDIKDAMSRWVVSTYSYPKEWIEERKALEDWLNKNLPSKKKQHDYEILSLNNKYGDPLLINNDGTYGCYNVLLSRILDGGAIILSVKRLSDNEVFTIGDRIWSKVNCQQNYQNIDKIELINNEVIYLNNCPLNNAVKSKSNV